MKKVIRILISWGTSAAIVGFFALVIANGWIGYLMMAIVGFFVFLAWLSLGFVIYQDILSKDV